MNGLSVFITVVLFVLAAQLSAVLHKAGALPEQRQEQARKQLAIEKMDHAEVRTAPLNL